MVLVDRGVEFNLLAREKWKIIACLVYSLKALAWIYIVGELNASLDSSSNA